ncbi:GABA transporter 1 [Medicago truncatula]|uniref:GABA transporter 1 n=1 Tax=Medicago truncatula TaxID=3880 RepID=UPI000D2F462C|nr:GABA transporter 1 [Medicago truncatula]
MGNDTIQCYATPVFSLWSPSYVSFSLVFRSIYPSLFAKLKFIIACFAKMLAAIKALQDMPLMSLDYGFLVMRVSLLSLIGKFGLFDFLTYECSNINEALRSSLLLTKGSNVMLSMLQPKTENLQTKSIKDVNLMGQIIVIASTLPLMLVMATLAPPVKGKMFKELSVCYTVVAVTFFSVAISGYWAYGNESEGLILSNFVDNGKPLVPKWFIYMTKWFLIQVYLQPTNEVLEQTFGDPKSPEFSNRNVIPRPISRSIAITISTLIAAMLPFFGDINSLIGAFGFMPLDFVLPVIFFNLTFKPSKRSLIFWLNVTIAVVFSALGAIAAIAAVRQIILDAKNYQLFANV